jgi:hypothetical protein
VFRWIYPATRRMLFVHFLTYDLPHHLEEGKRGAAFRRCLERDWFATQAPRYLELISRNRHPRR